MTLHIKDPKADKLARELAKVTGETLTEAVTNALEERLARTRRLDEASIQRRIVRMREIAHEIAQLPVLDDRPADEILGYNEDGLFD